MRTKEIGPISFSANMVVVLVSCVLLLLLGLVLFEVPVVGDVVLLLLMVSSLL